MKLSRAFVPAALAGALLLTGCTGGGAPTADASGADCLASGEASKSIKVTGTTGTDLTLTSEAPYTVTTAERSVLTEGSGAVPEDGQTVTVSTTIFNGKNGEVAQQVPASQVTFGKDAVVGWAYEGMRCATAGSQVVVVAPYADVFNNITPDQTGVADLSEDDSLVIVMDVSEISDEPISTGEPGTLNSDELLSRAEGTAQKAPAGFPSVKLADSGEPTITMPDGADAPSELEIATLIEGDGEEVKSGDRVYVNYRGVIWRTGEEFDSSWTNGAPANFITTQVIAGFTQALEGQKVGSQVIAVVPPADGYGESTESNLKRNNPDFDVTNDDTLVFVLDILGTVHADG